MTLKMEIKEEPMMVDSFDSLYHPETSSSIPAYSGLPPSPQSSLSSSASSSSSSTTPPEIATSTSEGKLLVPSDIHVMSSPTTLPSTPVTLNSSSPSPKSSLSIAETSFLSLSQSTWSSSSSSTVSSSPSSLSSVSSTPEKLVASVDCKDSPGKVRSKFSIEEILKPSFGSKKSQDFHENQSPVVLQPLDMRKHSLVDKEHCCKAEKPQVGLCEDNSCHHYGSCDEFSNCSSSSNSSSPEGGHNSSSNSNSSNSSRCSDTNNSFSMKYDRFGQHLTQDMRSIFAMSSYHHKEAIPFFAKCQFPAAIPYHNALNQYFYGFNISSLRNQIFHDIKMSKLLMDPQNIYQNSARNQIFQMNPKDFNEDVKLPLYNNSAMSSDISKSPRPANLASVSSSSVRQCFDRTSVATCRNADTRRAQSTELNKNTSFHASNISKSFQNNSNSCSNNSVVSSNNSNNTNNNSSSIKSDNGDAPNGQKEKVPFPLPAWVYCTRYSDRPSSGPRYRKPRKRTRTENDKRPRTAFSSQQLQRLRHEFDASPYLSESRRKCLAAELGLNESQVKIWFQNKRAKLKKGSGSKNLLAMKLMEEGLYNHSTIVVDEYDDNMNDKNDDIH